MDDPRARLALACGFAGAVVATERPVALVAEYLLLAGLVAVLALGGAYRRWLRLVVPMALFFGGVTWWAGTLADAGAAAGKLLSLTTAFFVFFETTAPEDLANSLVRSGLSYRTAFVLATAMQFVPVIGRKARAVMDAQRSRGIRLEAGWAAVRHWPAFLAPLLIQSFQLADELAEAMEARGFGRPGRTFYRDFRMRTADWLTAAGGAGLLAVGIWWL